MIKRYLIGLLISMALTAVGWAIQRRLDKISQSVREAVPSVSLADDSSEGSQESLAVDETPLPPDDANIVAVGPQLRSGAYCYRPEPGRVFRPAETFWGRGPVRRGLRWLFCPRFRRGCR